MSGTYWSDDETPTAPSRMAWSDDVAHALQLFGRRAAVGLADDEIAHAARPDERGEVDGAAAALEGLEVAVERREVGREAVALVDVLALGEHRVVQGRDRGALARDLGRDALGDLRGRALVDEHVVLGLAEQVDEARASDVEAAASIVRLAAWPESAPTAAILPSRTPTSATNQGALVPSTTRPPVMSRSYGASAAGARASEAEDDRESEERFFMGRNSIPWAVVHAAFT